MTFTLSGVRSDFGRSNQDTEFVLPGCKSVCTASLVDSVGGYICVMESNKKPFMTFQKGRLLCYRNSVQDKLKDLDPVTLSNIQICSGGGKARVSGERDYFINGPSSSPSVNMSFSLGIFLMLPLLWHIFWIQQELRNTVQLSH